MKLFPLPTFISLSLPSPPLPLVSPHRQQSVTLGRVSPPDPPSHRLSRQRFVLTNNESGLDGALSLSLGRGGSAAASSPCPGKEREQTECQLTVEEELQVRTRALSPPQPPPPRQNKQTSNKPNPSIFQHREEEEEAGRERRGTNKEYCFEH
jgi:hypothetical protein